MALSSSEELDKKCVLGIRFGDRCPSTIAYVIIESTKNIFINIMFLYMMFLDCNA